MLKAITVSKLLLQSTAVSSICLSAPLSLSYRTPLNIQIHTTDRHTHIYIYMCTLTHLKHTFSLSLSPPLSLSLSLTHSHTHTPTLSLQSTWTLPVSSTFLRSSKLPWSAARCNCWSDGMSFWKSIIQIMKLFKKIFPQCQFSSRFSFLIKHSVWYLFIVSCINVQFSHISNSLNEKQESNHEPWIKPSILKQTNHNALIITTYIVTLAETKKLLSHFK